MKKTSKAGAALLKKPDAETEKIWNELKRALVKYMYPAVQMYPSRWEIQVSDYKEPCADPNLEIKIRVKRPGKKWSRWHYPIFVENAFSLWNYLVAAYRGFR